MKHNKRLLAKFKNGNTILEVFEEDGGKCARTSEVIDDNLQDVSPLDNFENDVTMEEIISFYDMEGCEKID